MAEENGAPVKELIMATMEFSITFRIGEEDQESIKRAVLRSGLKSVSQYVREVVMIDANGLGASLSVEDRRLMKKLEHDLNRLSG